MWYVCVCMPGTVCTLVPVQVCIVQTTTTRGHAGPAFGSQVVVVGPSRLCGAGVRGVRGAERKSREKEEIWAGSRAQCLPMGGASEIQPAQLGSRQVIMGALGECGPGSAVALALESIFFRLHNGHLRVGGGGPGGPEETSRDRHPLANVPALLVGRV